MCSSTNWFSSEICLFWCVSCCWEDKARLWLHTHPKNREQPELTPVLVSPPTTSNAKCDTKIPQGEPMAAELCNKVTREVLQAYRVLLPIGRTCKSPELSVGRKRKLEQWGFLAVFLHISPGFWKVGVRQRASDASSFMVLYTEDPHELEPLVVLFHSHFPTSISYFHSHSTENGKISNFHSDSRNMTSLDIQFYATEEMPSFAGFMSQK